MNPQALDALRDIHLPASPAWWNVPEFWIAGCVLVIAATWFIRHRLRHRLLRQSMRDLSSLEAAHAGDGDTVRLARGLSQLLRRHASACFPDSGVDGLAGGEWLAFLDARSSSKAFTQGPGAVLESLPYRPSGTADARALVEAVRQWLRENPR